MLVAVLKPEVKDVLCIDVSFLSSLCFLPKTEFITSEKVLLNVPNIHVP